jgi:hypothetical protein
MEDSERLGQTRKRRATAPPPRSGPPPLARLSQRHRAGHDSDASYLPSESRLGNHSPRRWLPRPRRGRRAGESGRSAMAQHPARPGPAGRRRCSVNTRDSDGRAVDSQVGLTDAWRMSNGCGFGAEQLQVRETRTPAGKQLVRHPDSQTRGPASLLDRSPGAIVSAGRLARPGNSDTPSRTTCEPSGWARLMLLSGGTRYVHAQGTHLR